MKTKLLAHNPKFKIFYRFWLVQFIFMLVIASVFFLIVDDGETLWDYLKSVGFIVLVLPIINSFISTNSARRHTFTITEVEDTTNVADWAVELLLKNGMRIKAEHQNETILEPAKSVLRWFGNRFGTEQATVKYTDNEVTIAGHSKYIDIIDSKIKFGHVTFLNQPYNHS